MVKVNQPIHALDAEGNVIETGRASKIMSFQGLDRVPVDEAKAGDIIARRSDRRDRVQHHFRSAGYGTDQGPADRSADPVDAFRGE